MPRPRELPDRARIVGIGPVELGHRVIEVVAELGKLVTGLIEDLLPVGHRRNPNQSQSLDGLLRGVARIAQISQIGLPRRSQVIDVKPGRGTELVESRAQRLARRVDPL